MNNLFEKIPYKDKRVRVVWQPQQSTLWLNLTDLCEILKRKILISNGKALELCPSRTQFKATDNGKAHWYIRVFELRNLTSFIKTDNKKIAAECTQLENWAARQEDNYLGSISQGSKSMAGKPLVFNYEKKSYGFKQINNRLYANATQMGQPFNKLPSEWLRLVEVQKLREDLITTGAFASMDEQVITSRGATGGTWIENTIAEKFAEWLSPDFALWYKQLVQQLSNSETGIIRSKPQIKAASYPEPTTLEEAKRLLAQMHEQFEEIKHKIEFYNDFIEDRSWFKSTSIAEELKTTPSQLHKFLVEQQVCVYEKKQHRARLSYLQCEVPYLWKAKSGKFYSLGKSLRWTHAGREYIIDLWKKHHS